MDASELKPGDLLEDTRRGIRLLVIKVDKPGRMGVIRYDEFYQYGTAVTVRSCAKTFRQFARFKFLRRVEAG